MFFILLSSNTLEPFLIPLCLLHPNYLKSLLSMLFTISQNPVNAYPLYSCLGPSHYSLLDGLLQASSQSPGFYH